MCVQLSLGGCPKGSKQAPAKLEGARGRSALDSPVSALREKCLLDLTSILRGYTSPLYAFLRRSSLSFW